MFFFPIQSITLLTKKGSEKVLINYKIIAKFSPNIPAQFLKWIKISYQQADLKSFSAGLAFLSCTTSKNGKKKANCTCIVPPFYQITSFHFLSSLFFLFHVNKLVFSNNTLSLKNTILRSDTINGQMQSIMYNRNNFISWINVNHGK